MTGRIEEDQPAPQQPGVDVAALRGRGPGRRFVKGQSGNPAGRPPSRAYKAAYVAGALIQNKTVPLTRKLIELALSGDPAALRMCFQRIAPPPREAPLALDLPPVDSEADLADAIAALLDAAARGVISPTQAATLARTMLAMLHPPPIGWDKSLLKRRAERERQVP